MATNSETASNTIFDNLIFSKKDNEEIHSSHDTFSNSLKKGITNLIPTNISAGRLDNSFLPTVLTGVALLGSVTAGAYVFYKTRNTQTRVGNSIAGWLPNGEPITIRKRRTIKAKPSQVYAEWRNLENLPSILSHLKEVAVLTGTKSYWEAKGPAGTTVSWYATITEDEPGHAISWQAEENAEVPNSGRIVFSEKPNGSTLIDVRLTFQPLAGELGLSIARAFGENPAKQIENDLTNFKSAMEEKMLSHASLTS